MNKIKCIAFDFGGVVVGSNQSGAIRRFEEIGLADASSRLDKYHQTGIFGDLEEGKIDADTFVSEMERLTGRKQTFSSCVYAWRGYCPGVPERNLELLVSLHRRGYRLCLLSNSNPFMMSWARSKDFDGHGHSLDDYFDHLYISYELKISKPDEAIYRAVLARENIEPGELLFIDDGKKNIEAAARLGINTILAGTNIDWQSELVRKLEENKKTQIL